MRPDVILEVVAVAHQAPGRVAHLEQAALRVAGVAKLGAGLLALIHSGRRSRVA